MSKGDAYLFVFHVNNALSSPILSLKAFYLDI